MGAMIQTVKIVFFLIPALIELLKAVEEAIPGRGKGEEKIAMVREVFETIYGASNSLWPTLKSVIDVLVATFNKTGVFVKPKTDEH